MQKQIQLIKASGEITEIPFPSLAEMQKLVGGYIEHVTVLDRVENGKFIYTSMYVNENGLINSLPRNQVATELYQRNVRTQYPNSANPFIEAKEEFARRYASLGAALIDNTPKEAAGYAEDPWICGDVIFFAGYSRAEVDRLFNEWPEEAV